MNVPYFFYGSLRDPDVLSAVLGRSLEGLTFAPGQLQAFRAERALAYSFPLLVPTHGAVAEGLVTTGLSGEDVARIAYFEDSDYVRAIQMVEVADSLVPAHVFMAAERLESSGETWDFGRFQTHDKALLLAVTRHVMQDHYGRTPQSEMERLWAGIRDRFAAMMDCPPRPKARHAVANESF
ncbi:MAG TPA: hypothetical protein DCL54_10320 [Alphaproteobacteria bacterium]|nr:hypothetical protein [Alphaproteobacteria bacterium]HAJ46962.1 hypothetical protein [Alphaproteobacteria bacterium]